MYNCKCKLPWANNQTISTMLSSEILQGRREDVESTHQMFVSITDTLLANGVDQWNYDYPDPETLMEDVVNEDNFVIREGGKVLASIALNEVQDEQYRKIHWKHRDEGVLVIHRLGVSSRCPRQRIG